MAVLASSRPSPLPASPLVFLLPFPALIFLNRPALLSRHSTLNGFNLFSVPGFYWRHLLNELNDLKGKLLILGGSCGKRSGHRTITLLNLFPARADIVLRRVDVLLPCLNFALYRLLL
jgi:hypothetical protein